MHGHGIQGNAAACIENWLAGWRKRAIVNGVPPDWTAISTTGVSQWSFLGPTFLSSTSMTWALASLARCLSSLTIPSWVLMPLI